MLKNTNISNYGYTSSSPFRACPDFSSGRSGDEVVEGNVITVFSDRKIAQDLNADGVIDSYKGVLLASNDYTPFGMQMANRGLNASIGAYRFGFNGKENDNEVKGVGNSLDFGDRMQDPRTGRWNKCDRKQEKYPGWSPYHFGYNNPIVTIDPDGEENIVIAGSQYQNTAGNKLMFVNQAMRQLKYYKKNENSESRSLILFTEGYTVKQLERIKQVAKDKYGAEVIEVKTSEELINYINTKSIGSKDPISLGRSKDKITNVDMFAHGKVGEIRFGYETQIDKQATFNSNSLDKINSMSFSKDATISSYACRTGIGREGEFFLATSGVENSLAQKIADKVGVKVNAYAKRTDYSATLGTFVDRLYGKNTEIGKEIIDGADFRPEGAIHGVRGGSSPKGDGVPINMKTYNRK